MSETWTSKDTSFYKSVQKKIATSLGFIIVFLYREILCTSKKEFARAFTLCLEEIMANFLVTVEYSGIKYTPQQLKQMNHKTASRELFNNILIIDEDTPLISQKQQESLKISDYQNVSKTLFNTDSWRDVMMNSQQLEEIIEAHICSDILETIDKKKRIYAKNMLEIELAAERSKDDKATKIHSEILEVAMTISEQSTEVKNKLLVKNEELRRFYKHEWKNIAQDLVLWKGVWRDKVIFDKNPQKVPNTVSNTLISGYSKPILESRTEEDYQFFDEKTSDKHIRENRINFLKNDAFCYQPKNPLTSNVQTNRSGDKSNVEIKIFSKDLSDREIDILSQNYVNYLLDVTPKSKSVKQFDCNMVCQLYIRTGKVAVTNTTLYFFDDLKALSQNYEYSESTMWKKSIDFIKYKKEDSSLLSESWDLGDIWAVHYRSFLSKNSAVEIFFTTNKTMMLHFNSQDERDSFCKQLYKYRDKKETSKHFLVQNGKKALKERKITERWMNWQISNFEYLMLINIYANRSYNDLSHYPVFPWLHLNKNPFGLECTSITDCARNLALNMGQLGSKERLEEFMRKYEEGD